MLFNKCIRYPLISIFKNLIYILVVLLLLNRFYKSIQQNLIILSPYPTNFGWNWLWLIIGLVKYIL